MKLHQRYVFLLTVFIVALVTVSVILTVTSQQQLYDTVKGVQGVIKRQLEMRQRPVPNKFVRQLTAEEFRENPLYKTGNPLIDQYTNNDLSAPGEFGRALVMPADLQDNATAALNTYHINVLASDMIHLNRMVPDSRFPGVVNRSPRHMLWEVVLVDDASTMVGLIRARMEGIRFATGEVIVIFDSHMEVNLHWLEPLLHQVQSDRQSVALGHLDYVQPDTFLYDWHKGYLTRYGFDWRLVFFETFFKPLTAGQDDTTPKPGALMVGAAFAVDREYFLEIGGYDEGMDVWGGENLELSWRIWMCGGSLIHVPCSKIGHIARVQPYSFPGGRREIEVHNYKRAVSLWMEDNHRRFIYDHYPDMEAACYAPVSSVSLLKKKRTAPEYN
nr:hypothetical protein BaRGS_029977 [Batillaria attramentaria]